MRFTLPKLFFAVTMAALACAGLTMRSRGWAETIVTLSVVMFAIVGLTAIASAGRLRVFRVAFALIGGGYMLVVMCSLLSPLRDSLLTTRALVMTAKGLKVPTTPAFMPILQRPSLTSSSYLPATPTTVPPTAASATPVAPSIRTVYETSTAPNGTPITTARVINVTSPPQPTIASGSSSSGTGSSTSSAIYSYITSTPMIYDPMDSILDPNSQGFNYDIPAVSFLVIGHCVWAWLLALAGGWFAAYLVFKAAASELKAWTGPFAAGLHGIKSPGRRDMVDHLSKNVVSRRRIAARTF